MSPAWMTRSWDLFSQPQRRIVPCTSKRGILPDDSVNESGWPLPEIFLKRQQLVDEQECGGLGFKASYTLTLQPNTQNPKLKILNPKPYILNPAPYTLRLKSWTLNRNHEPGTLNPEPWTLLNPTQPHTLNPKFGSDVGAPACEPDSRTSLRSELCFRARL